MNPAVFKDGTMFCRKGAVMSFLQKSGDVHLEPKYLPKYDAPNKLR